MARYKYAVHAVILVLLIIMINAPLAAAQQDKSWTATVTVLVPAVTDDLRGGRLVEVSVTVSYPGSGNIVVTSGGEVDDTTRTSMEMAVYTASLLAGVYWDSVDVEVKINSLGSVAGPSGSLAVAIAALKAMVEKRDSSIEGYVITGAISPDSLSAGVGGIDVKCRIANEAGYILMLPTVNAQEAPQGCRSVAVPGVMYALEVMGWPAVRASVTHALPGEFNSVMLGTAENMRVKALQVLEEARKYLNQESIRGFEAQVSDLLERSEDLEKVSPYAAASQAFGALTRALEAYYLGLLESIGPQALGDALARLQGEAERLEDKLHGMPGTGSIYYIEFLSTAYTRMADARGTLAEVEVHLSAGSFEAAALALAYAHARLYTIDEWIRTAERLQGVGATVSPETLSSLAVLASEYVEKAVEYAKSLAEYQIRVYNVPWEQNLRAYLAGIDDVVAQARDYLKAGNNIAALGFYREALARTLSLVFAGPAAAIGDEALYRQYIEEMDRMYAFFTLRGLSTGMASGLAEAYKQYSEAIMGISRGDSLLLREQAVASAVIWSLAAVAPETQVTPSLGGEGAGLGAPPAQVAGQFSYVLATFTVIVAAVIGFLAGVRAAVQARKWWVHS